MIRIALLFFLALLRQCRCEVAVAGLSQDVGLTSAEEKALLDEHNVLRSRQARGEVPGQPPAADMVRLEWNAESAKHAQTWSNNCGGPMHGNHKRYGEGQDYAGHGDRSILLKEAFVGWFDKEHPIYTYGSHPGAAGHYTQIVTAYTHEIGCGANKCAAHTYGRLVCNFFMGGNLFGKPPFQKGPACSKCPKGFGYCKDSLCTSARVCGGDSSCKCTVDQGKCAANGQFDAATCSCKCNTGFTGLNCDEICKNGENKMCGPRSREGECKPSKSNPYFQDMILNCPAACGLCKAACKNKADNCADLKEWGNCEDAKEYMEEFCPAACGMC